MTRALDIVIACVFIVLTFPLMIVVALAIKLDSRGPILSRTNPLGHDGANRANILRFSTTLDNPAVLGGGPRWTRIGWFLYFTRINDLPQLFNVLRGDLSLMDLRDPISADRTPAGRIWW